MLWNCEKENINETSKPQSFIEEIQQVFNKEDFAKSIPYEFDVNWDLAKKDYSEELKTDYYEFPIRYSSSLTPHINDLKKTKGNYFKSYKIIATVKNEEIKFYVLRVYEKISEAGQIISEAHFNFASNFNGLIHLVDKNDEIIFAKKIEKGAELIKDYYAKDLKELDPIKSRAPDGDCVTVRTEHWYYYYQWSQDVEVFLYSKKLLDITYEQICAYGYLPEYEEGMTNAGSGGGSPSGSGTYKKDCDSTTNSKGKYFSREAEGCAVKVTEEEVKCEKGFVMDSDGNCVEIEDEIFNELEGKDKCIFNELQKLNLFKSTIGKFSSGNYNLTFKYGSICNGQAGEDACTDASDLANGNITVKILSSGSQSLDFAATLLHEGIHAEIYKYVSEYKSGVDPNDRKNLLYYYNYYKAQNSNTVDTAIAQHLHMQDEFITPMAKALRELDNNSFALDYYKGFAWDGLTRRFNYDKYLENGVLKVMTPEKYNEYISKKKTVMSKTNFGKNCN